MKLLDTSFLIDLQREWVRKKPGPATGYLTTWREKEKTYPGIDTPIYVPRRKRVALPAIESMGEGIGEEAG